VASYPDAFQPIRALVTTPDLADDPDVLPRLRGMKFVTRATEWNNTSLQAKSGKKYVKQNWTFPINHFAVKFETLNEEDDRLDARRLEDFFDGRCGSYSPFYYWDPYRNLVTDQIIGVGDGATKQFQLVRRVRRYTEPVYVLTGAPVVKANWEQVTGFEIAAPGVILFDVAPAEGVPIAWSGSFLFWCRLSQDKLTLDQMNDHLFSSSDGLEFETIKR
jgi:hypothetical protein